MPLKSHGSLCSYYNSYNSFKNPHDCQWKVSDFYKLKLKIKQNIKTNIQILPIVIISKQNFKCIKTNIALFFNNIP